MMRARSTTLLRNGPAVAMRGFTMIELLVVITIIAILLVRPQGLFGKPAR